jgi:predicted enzyme related to lactoylglutathione lyase
MSERDGYPANVPCWIETSQPHPEAAVSFYAGLFGWQFEEVARDNAPGPYFIGRLRNKDVAAVAPVALGAPPTAMWNSYFWVDSADETVGKVREAGGRVLAEPFEVDDSGRMAVVADPSGAVLSVLQARAHRGAQLVNEPGTWVRNDLNTSDLERVKPFYRAVFGWETRSVDSGSSDFTWFTLRGYSAYLLEHDPELLDRLEKGGAPEDFENAVSFVTQRDSEVPPYWSVTFAVDDADATADRAADLGGTVVAPPFDAPYVRVTVIRDPQGAVFAASKYTGPG